MTCWAGFKNDPYPGKGSDQYFYLCFQGWKFCIFAQQVIFSLQVTKNNIIVGEWPLMQVPANDIWPIPRKTTYKIIYMDFFVDFSVFSKTAETPLIEPLKD